MRSSIGARRQAGDSKIGCIFWTALLAFFVFVAWQVVPLKMKSIDLEEFMVRQAEQASLRSRDVSKKMQANILKQADDLGLPLDKDNLKITRTGTRMRIEASYTLPINLIVTTYEWKVDHKVERNIMRI